MAADGPKKPPVEGKKQPMSLEEKKQKIAEHITIWLDKFLLKNDPNDKAALKQFMKQNERKLNILYQLEGGPVHPKGMRGWFKDKLKDRVGLFDEGTELFRQLNEKKRQQVQEIEVKAPKSVVYGKKRIEEVKNESKREWRPSPPTPKGSRK